MSSSPLARRSALASLGPRPAPTLALHVVPQGDTGYGLALVRTATISDGEADGELVVRVWGDPLRAVMDQVLGAIRRAGYRSTDLTSRRRAPFHLHEEDAVRLGLLFLALKPLTKPRRIEEVADGIALMADEEAYYWFSKATTGAGGRHVRALRIMLSDE